MFGVRLLACEHEPERTAPETELPSLPDLAFELSARCGLRKSHRDSEILTTLLAQLYPTQTGSIQNAGLTARSERNGQYGIHRQIDRRIQ